MTATIRDMARHLHPQAGGDPTAQGPVRELANEPHSPDAENRFPDVPEGNRPSDDARVDPDTDDADETDDADD